MVHTRKNIFMIYQNKVIKKISMEFRESLFQIRGVPLCFDYLTGNINIYNPFQCYNELH